MLIFLFLAKINNFNQISFNIHLNIYYLEIIAAYFFRNCYLGFKDYHKKTIRKICQLIKFKFGKIISINTIIVK